METPSSSESNHTDSIPRPSLVVRLIRLMGRLASLGTLLSFLASYHWIPDILSHFRVHYLFLLFPYWLLMLRRRAWGPSIVLAALLAPNLWSTMPYWIPSKSIQPPTAAADVARYRIGIFNVLRTNEEFGPTLEFLLREEPDFLFLMEVQQGWTKHLESIRDRYPYQKNLASQDYLGIVFLSKIPWDELEVISLGEVRNPSLDIRFRSDSATGAPLRLIATHPLPPFGDSLTRSRDQQLIDLATRLQGVSHCLMVGDFNVSPWSPRFAKVLEAGNLVDASKGFGWTPTLGPVPTWLGGIKVDHVLCSQDVSISSFRALHTYYSDHRLVLCEFALIPTSDRE